MTTQSVIPGNVQVKASYDGNLDLMSITSPTQRMITFKPYYFKVSDVTLNFMARMESAWAVRQGIESTITVTCDMPIKVLRECMSFPTTTLWEPQELKVPGVETVIVYNQICD